MMGQLSSGQDRLFYSFNLEDHIPANHLLRSIDQCLDLSDLRHYLADFYSPIGRPSIDPELMIRMLIVGYCYGIRSERRLCEEAHLNLAYRWFCRLSLEDEVPNHSTFSKNRHGRFRDSDLFRWLFNEVLRRCMDAGLVKGEGALGSGLFPAGKIFPVRGKVFPLESFTNGQTHYFRHELHDLTGKPLGIRDFRVERLHCPLQHIDRRRPAEEFLQLHYMVVDLAQDQICILHPWNVFNCQHFFQVREAPQEFTLFMGGTHPIT